MAVRPNKIPINPYGGSIIIDGYAYQLVSSDSISDSGGGSAE